MMSALLGGSAQETRNNRTMQAPGEVTIVEPDGRTTGSLARATACRICDRRRHARLSEAAHQPGSVQPVEADRPTDAGHCRSRGCQVVQLIFSHKPRAKSPGPFHVINIALNLAEGRQLGLATNGEGSKPPPSVPPQRSGNRVSSLAGGVRGQPASANPCRPGSSHAISGPAASPNMGYPSRDVPLWFLWALPGWLGNPPRVTIYHRSRPRSRSVRSLAGKPDSPMPAIRVMWSVRWRALRSCLYGRCAAGATVSLSMPAATPTSPSRISAPPSARSDRPRDRYRTEPGPDQAGGGREDEPATMPSAPSVTTSR